MLARQGYFYLGLGRREEAGELLQESLVLCRDFLGEPHGTAVSLEALSAAANRLDQYAIARQWSQESFKITKTTNDQWGMALSHRRLGLICLESGAYMRATTLLRQSVSQFREIGDLTLMVMTLVDLGVAMRVSGAYAESREYLLEALQAAVETKNWLNALSEYAAIEMEEGTGERALELVIQCLQHSSTNRELTKSVPQLTLGRWGQQRPARLGRLQAKLESQLTSQQIAAV